MVGKAHLLDTAAPPSSDLSRLSKSSFVVAGCQKKAMLGKFHGGIDKINMEKRERERERERERGTCMKMRVN